ncbi:MAG: hypothetical protein ABSD49_12705 [Candidatus Bathyarchaeia archaeon]|jgi:hypothetical protein
MKLDFDLIACDPSSPDGWVYKRNPDGSVVDEWGRILSFDSSSRVWIQTSGSFKSIEEFEAFELPDPNTPGRTFALEKEIRLRTLGRCLVSPTSLDGSTVTPPS